MLYRDKISRPVWKIMFTCLFLLGMLNNFLPFQPVFAQESVREGFNKIAEQIFDQEVNVLKTGSNLANETGKILLFILGLAGVAFFLLLTYGGILWMVSEGDEKKIGDAINIIKNAFIGFMIALVAFTVVSFIIGLGGDILVNKSS